MNELNIATIGGVECYEKNGTAYLRLETVARGLGFTQKKNGVEYVKWERVNAYLNELGFSPLVGKDNYIPENIFYRLAMKAKNEAAEAFQAKIADEVIPAIRRHGAYMTPDTIERVLSDPDTIIKLATSLKEEQAARKALEAEKQANAPKVLFAGSVSASKTSILISELAKLLRQNGVDMGQRRLFTWMRDKGYLIRRPGSEYNLPTQRAMEMGLFEIKETSISHSDGHITLSKTPKVTGKGQVYFVNLFLGKEEQA